MSNNVDLGVEGIKTLPGIDTLYYFVSAVGSDYIKFYQDCIENEFIDGDNWKFLGYSGKSRGFVGSWFEYSIKSDKYSLFIPIFKVGFKSPFKQANLSNVYVQLLATGIYLLGLKELIKKVSSVLNDFFEVSSDDFSFQVSRADVNMFVNFDFSKANWQCFKSPARSYTQNFGYEYVNGSQLETIYIGKRSSGVFLRLYNKLKELDTLKLKNPIKYIIMTDYFSRNGFSGVDFLWNIEFVLKREVLKSYSIFSISDLFAKVGNVFKDLMSKYVFLGFDSDKYEKLRKSKHLNRLSSSPVWDYFGSSFDIYSTDFVERKIKKYDIDYDSYYKDKLVSDFLSAYRIGVDVNMILFSIFKYLGQNEKVFMLNTLKSDLYGG